MSKEFRITISDNQDFQYSFQWVDRETGEPYDFTGSTFKMDIKTDADAGAVSYTMTTSNNRVLSTDLANGLIELVIEKGALGEGDYVADLIRINGARNEKLTDFEIVVEKGVTA